MSELRESFACDSTVKVDRDAGIIKGVKLLGAEGNCHYGAETRKGAIGLLEGRRIYADHGPRGSKEPRSYRDALGVTTNVREGQDALYGDIKYNPKHPLAEQLAWDAENAPHLLGMSITGDGAKRREGKRVICESITRIDSCDLVTTPAHGGGLFEGHQVAQLSVRELKESLKAKRPGFYRALCEMSDPASGILTDDTMMDAPAEDTTPADTTEDADHEATFIQGVKDAIGKVLDGDGSWEEKTKQVMKYLKTAKKHTSEGEGGSSESAETETKTETTEESKVKKQANLREDALLALGRKGVKLTPTVELAIKGCSTKEEVTRLVESLDPAAAAPVPAKQMPRSATPTREQQQSLRESKEQPQQDPDKARKDRVQSRRAQR